MASSGPPGFSQPLYGSSPYSDGEGPSTPYHGTSGHDSTASEIPTTEIPTSEIPNTSKGVERGKTSWAWKFYQMVQVDRKPGKNEERFEGTCLVCQAKGLKKVYQWTSGGGTGTFVRHLNRDHHMEYDQANKKVIISDSTGRTQTQLGGFMDNKPGGGMPFHYTHASNIEGMSRFVIVAEQPFTFAENDDFQEYQKGHVNPQWDRVPRNTLKRSVTKRYKNTRNSLIEMFGEYKGRVSLTCDCWRSPQYDSYICITVHWCDKNYNIQKRIIAFDKFDESHSTVNIYNRVKQTLIEFNLDSKLFCISFDNAFPNTAAIPLIKETLPLLLDGKLVHVRCCAHILNLCVQDGLVNIYECVEPIRKIINWVRNSSTITRKFRDFCVKNNLKRKKFCIYTKTRWNSTFIMLRQALTYKDALTAIYNDEMIQKSSLHRIRPELWHLVERTCNLLECFYKSTLVFSLVYESNVHLVIMECYKIVASMDECFGISEDLDLVILSMKSKWLSYLEIFPPLYGIATMFDPAVKKDGLTTILTAYYNALHLDFDVDLYVEKCYSILLKLYDVYYAEMHPEQSSAAARPPKSGRFGSTIANLLVKSKRSSSSTSSSVRSVLESYFSTDEYINEDDDNDFVILKYWRSKSSHWPVLAAIARDILVVPASTVASESAFSSGRRIVTDYRHSLNETQVKICVSLRDWLRADERTQDMEQSYEDEVDYSPWLEFTDTESSSAGSAGGSTAGSASGSPPDV